MFVVEGKLALEAVLASPYPLRSVLVLRRRLHFLEELALPPAVSIYGVDEDVMASVTGFDVHRGLLGVAGRLPPEPPEDLLTRVSSRSVVVVEGVNDQENLGAIFRNAAAFGSGAVFLDPTCADPLYRRTVRVSLGHVLRVPFARLAPWPGSLNLLAARRVCPAGPHAGTGGRTGRRGGQPAQRFAGGAGRGGRRPRPEPGHPANVPPGADTHGWRGRLGQCRRRHRGGAAPVFRP